MNHGIATIFTTTFGLQPPWHVATVDLNPAELCIEFKVEPTGRGVACPACGVEQHRGRRSWRPLDFFQFEAWLHAEAPRVQRTGCGKNRQLPVPWLREGSGWILLIDAPGLSLCPDQRTRQAASQMWVVQKLRCGEFATIPRWPVPRASARAASYETNVKRRHQYITVVHDPQVARVQFACPGRDHQTVGASPDGLCAHGRAPPNPVMDEVRCEEMRTAAPAVREAVSATSTKSLRLLLWRMRSESDPRALRRNALAKTPKPEKRAASGGSGTPCRSPTARRTAVPAECALLGALTKWTSWARRSRLEPFKGLAATLKEHFRGPLRDRARCFIHRESKCKVRRRSWRLFNGPIESSPQEKTHLMTITIEFRRRRWEEKTNQL